VRERTHDNLVDFTCVLTSLLHMKLIVQRRKFWSTDTSDSSFQDATGL